MATETQNNNTIPRDAFTRRNANMIDGDYLRGLPRKEDYDTEEDWRIACYKRFVSKSAPRMSDKHAMMRLALDMYIATTDTSSIPPYATVPGSDVATSSVPYEHNNPLFAPIRKRVGMFKQAEIVTNATIVNASAHSRKEDMYVADIMARAMGGQMGNIEALSGMPLPNPQAEMQAHGFSGPFSEYMDKKYRDYWEHRAEKIINDWIAKSDFKETLDQQYLNYALTQTVVFWPRINPMTKQVEIYVEDPTQILWDMDMQDQHGRDMQWAIRYRYFSENEILHQYDISRDELQKFRGYYAPTFFSSVLPAYKEVDTTFYYLVAECRWLYTEDMSVENAKRHTDMDVIVTPEYTEKDSLRYEEVYNTVIIGHYHELEGGRMPNQVRSVDITSKGNLGVFVLSLDHQINPLAPTNGMRVQSYVRLRNMLFFKLTQQIADMKGVFIEVDTSLLPEAQDGQPDYQRFFDDMLGNKVVWKDSTQGGMLMDQAVSLRQQEVVTVKNAGMPSDLPVLINMINVITTEINTILSINDSSLGTIGQYQNATTATLNMNAYQAAIEYEDKEFKRITERVLTYIANLNKILDVVQDTNSLQYGNEEAIDAVVIRNGDDYLEVDPEGFLFQDIGIRIQIETDSVEKRQRMQQYLLAGMQNGTITLPQLIEFESSDNVSDGMYRLKIMLEDNERKAREQQAQQQQMAMQQQQLAMQQQAQLQSQRSQEDLQSDLMKQEQKKDLELRNANVNTENNAKMQQQAKATELQSDIILDQATNTPGT